MTELLPESEIGNWTKSGRGRTFDFVIDDRSVGQVLLQGLPDKFGPYEVCSFNKVETTPRYYAWVSRSVRADAIGELVRDGDWDFFIRSSRLSPQVEWSNLSYPMAFCPLNGFIHLCHGHIFRGIREDSSIGIVDKISKLDGERQRYVEHIEHVEYRTIFESLKKAFWPYRKRTNKTKR